MCLKLGKKARKKSEKVTEKARKKSEKMADKARKQSGKIADKLEEPIEALKGLVVIDKLDAVGEDAAEHLKESFVAVLDNIPPIPLLKSIAVGSLVPKSAIDKAQKLCGDLYIGFMDKCGFPPDTIQILSNIQELTLRKIFKYYKLDGAGFDKIKKGAKFLGQMNPSVGLKWFDGDNENKDLIEDDDEDDEN